MASSRMIVTRKRPVFMSHICSKCGFPVISIVPIEAEAQKTYTFSQDKASQIAAETADDAIRKEIARIESCKNTKSVLVGKKSGSSMIAPGHFCSSSFSGFQTPCPFCSNLEPWQSISSNKSILELQDENFPIVFTDAQKAEAWAHGRVKDAVESIIKENESQEAKDKATKNAILANARMEKLSLICDQIPERSIIRQLEKEQNELSNRKQHLGILDFSGKKDVKTRLDVIGLKLVDLRKELALKEAPILDELLESILIKMASQIAAFGSPNEIMSKRSGDTFVFYYSVYNIPQALIEEFEKPIMEDTSVDLAMGTSRTNKVQETENEIKAHPLFCRKCGNKLVENSIFCSKCGTRVE